MIAMLKAVYKQSKAKTNTGNVTKHLQTYEATSPSNMTTPE